MSFNEDLEYGRIGEIAARHILESSNKVKSVLDCTKDKYFQQFDIDYLAEQDNGRVLKCEVKTDRLAHLSGNIVWEKSTSGHPGCLEKTIADIVFYYLSVSKTMYIFTPATLKKYIELKQPKEIEMGDYATGYLLSIGELLELKLIREVSR